MTASENHHFVFLGMNDLVKIDESLWRVLHIEQIDDGDDKADEESCGAYLLSMECKKPLPEWRSFAFLDKAAGEHRLELAALEPANRPTQTLDSDRRLGKVRWTRIEELVAPHNTPRIFISKGRGKWLKDHAKVHGTTDNTLLADLRQYWKGGQTEEALLGGYFKCGTVKPEHALTKEIDTGHRKTHVIFKLSDKGIAGRKPKNNRYKKFNPRRPQV
ncbi:hypothetical protein QTH97_35765 [Variovorax sp. J22R24]|uniref:hypothetical protein n=1 Tax=Variovorax gracilis TaxID=3053502 RepID=UPI002578FA74|nr:hypothetical protein [Variovorax sp. J22R24]MDM0110294.1 hypothetical protein [Variovorax sp. J22R24]